jgi:hypothetical protein
MIDREEMVEEGDSCTYYPVQNVGAKDIGVELEGDSKKGAERPLEKMFE